MKKEIVTSIAGQDGTYLADLLLSKGYYTKLPHPLCKECFKKTQPNHQ